MMPLQRHGRLFLVAGILPLLTLTSLLTLSSLRAGRDQGDSRSPLAAQVAPGSASTSSVPTGGATLLIRPHCENAVSWTCPSYATQDPQTLVTPTMHIGDTLDLDIIVRNPSGAAIQHVLAWLAYDPNLLTGKSVTPGASFPLAAPGGQDFDAKKGLVMLDMETKTTDGLKDSTLVVARVTFTIAAAPAGSKAVIAFHDPDGSPPHTAIFTAAPAVNILSKPMGSLAVAISSDGASAPVAASSAPQSSAAALPPVPSVGSSASSHTSIASSVASSVATSSAASSASVDTSSSLAGSPAASSASSDEVGTTVSSSASSTPEATHGAASFGEIQPQNVRVTTDRSTLYVAWDAIPSPDLRGYHVYYGTQTGRYIQRRTVRPDQTGISIHSLFEATRYYVAVRGFNEQGEETAFSKEAAVVVGSPGTSTSPLSGDVIGSMNGGNPVSGSRDVPGNAGTGEMVILILVSAVIGTLFAFRRQHVASSRPIHG